MKDELHEIKVQINNYEWCDITEHRLDGIMWLFNQEVYTAQTWVENRSENQDRVNDEIEKLQTILKTMGYMVDKSREWGHINRQVVRLEDLKEGA